MVILEASENKEGTKKLELWTIWGLISIQYSEKTDGEYKRKWIKDYRTIERAGLWFVKYEISLLGLTTPEERHPKINITIHAGGEITLGSD